MTSFDFEAYIASQIPSLRHGQAQIHLLSGGFINFTSRVTFDPPVVFQSHTLHSAILKQAPPYVASTPDQELSVHRQTIESRALEFLAGKDPLFPVLADLSTTFPDLRFPRLIYHDLENHVLWMTDLGRCQGLAEYLKAEQSPEEGHVRNLANQLANFVCETYRLTIDPPKAFLNSLEDPNKTEGGDMGFLADITKGILTDANVEDAEELSQVVRRGLQARPEHPSLGMGDFWPASVLIDPQGACGLIDWEYFGPCDPASELGMFLAHLHIMSLDVQTTPSAASAIRAFTTQFLKSWAEAMRKQDSFSFERRRALVSHGRELVNGVDLYSKTLNVESKARLIQAGAQSLRVAQLPDGNEQSSTFGPREGLQFVWDDFEILQK